MSTAQTNFLSKDELQRYQRQMVLPEIGLLGQERLKKAKVLCVGAGGLGSPVLLYLAAAGVGTLGIIDMDEVDVSNLQRQILYSEKDANSKKARVAGEKLRLLNQHLIVNVYEEAFNAANAEMIMRNYDLVVDGTDNFNTKYLINDCAIKCGIPNIYGSVLGFEGRVMIVHGNKGPCYRCLYPTPPKGYIPNCAEFGVVGALPGIIGCVQAMETIKWIVGQPEMPTALLQPFKPLLGILWTIDSRTMQSHSFHLKKKKDCIACSQDHNKIVLQDLNPLCALSKQTYITLTADEAKNYLAQPDVIFIDVRERSEWEAGHIPSATHLPLSLLVADESSTKKLNPEKKYLLYCHSGKRSQQAADVFLRQGIKNVMNLSGGLSAWEGDIEKVE